MFVKNGAFFENRQKDNVTHRYTIK